MNIIVFIYYINLVVFSTVGILYGLGAGFGYALYSIFARYALDRGYSSNTINFYSCLLTTIGAAIIWGAAQPLGVMIGSWKGFGLCTALGIVTCYLPYLLYTYGLTGLETLLKFMVLLLFIPSFTLIRAGVILSAFVRELPAMYVVVK